MDNASPSSDPPVGMGLTSVILGSVGTLLFFLPVLGIPLAAVGLVFGTAGLLTAILGGRTSLRWSAAGIMVSGLALGIGVVLSLAPAGFLPSPKGPPAEQSVPDQPYVPPPARPGT
jgi:hypothetical protein